MSSSPLKHNAGAKKTLKIGEWQIFPEENRITRGAEQQILVPKVMDLLLLLAQRPNQLCGFQEIHEHLWPDEFVNDNALYNLIGQLRKALGDKASQPKYIKTVSKKGYCLVATITEGEFANTAQKQNETEPPHQAWWTSKTSISACLLLFSIISASLFYQTKTPKNLELPSLAEQHFALADYKLLQDKQKEALDHVLQARSIAPGNNQLKLLEAHIYWQLANISNNSQDLFIDKLVRSVESLEPSREQALLGFLSTQPTAIQLKQYSANSEALSHWALSALAIGLFQRGLVKEAESTLLSAQQKCRACAYIHKHLAYTRSVLGMGEQAFSDFQQFLDLMNQPQNQNLKKNSYGEINVERLAETKAWLDSQPRIVVRSTPHRNSLAMFYLNIGDLRQAKKVMKKQFSNQDTDFFSYYTRAAIAGSSGDFVSAQRWLELRHKQFPDNPRFALSRVYATWLAQGPEAAWQVLQQLPEMQPSFASPEQGTQQLQLLFATLAKRTGRSQQNGAWQIALANQRINTDTLPEEASYSLIQRLILQDELEQALQVLKNLLASGWTVDYYEQWWPLEKDPFLQPLQQLPQFQILVADHQKKLTEICECQ